MSDDLRALRISYSGCQAATDPDGTTDYLYGATRLASVSGATRTWYLGDALGSTRRTMSDAGVLVGTTSYDPWGTPESGSVPTFGFTGELQDTVTGLVNLQARWYSTAKENTRFKR
jgi:hypothetical protein